MRYFVYIVTVVVCLTAGAMGTAYMFNSNFHAMTGLTWTEFAQASAGCEVKYEEKCRLYGGFAGHSSFKDEQPKKDAI